MTGKSAIHYRKLPDRLWDFIREHRMFGMIIPEAYGGLEFSAQGNSAVVMKLASRNLTTAITVMVPNSLGPGELLLHYGTDEQKESLPSAPRPGRGNPLFRPHLPFGGFRRGEHE